MDLPLAAGGFTVLIYFVIAVLWILGKVAEQKKAQERMEEMRRRREERERDAARRGGEPPARAPRPPVLPEPSLEQQIEAFLGRISGEVSEDPAPKRTPPAPREAIVFDRPPSAPPPPPPPTPALLSEEERAFRQVEDIRDIADVMDQAGETEIGSLLNVRTLMVDMSRASPRIPTVPTPRLSNHGGKADKPNLRRRATLQRAIIGSLLLDKPRGLQPPV